MVRAMNTSRNNISGVPCVASQYDATSTLDAFLGASESSLSTAFPDTPFHSRVLAENENVLCGSTACVIPFTRVDVATDLFPRTSSAWRDRNMVNNCQSVPFTHTQDSSTCSEQVGPNETCNATLFDIQASRYVALQDLIDYLHLERATRIDALPLSHSSAQPSTSSLPPPRTSSTVIPPLNARSLRSSVQSILREHNDLETVYLADEPAVRAGNFSALFDSGDLAVPTTFDNYVQHSDYMDGTCYTGTSGNLLHGVVFSRCAEDNAATIPTDTGDARRNLSTSQNDRDSLHNSSFIDDYLGLNEDGNNERTICSARRDDVRSASATPAANIEARTESARLASPMQGEVALCSTRTDSPHDRYDMCAITTTCDSPASSTLSDAESIDLPDETTCTVTRAYERQLDAQSLCEDSIRRLHGATARCSVHDLRALVSENDDRVHEFALDCAFNYDADLLGAALRQHGPLRCRLSDGV